MHVGANPSASQIRCMGGDSPEILLDLQLQLRIDVGQLLAFLLQQTVHEEEPRLQQVQQAQWEVFPACKSMMCKVQKLAASQIGH